MVSVIIPFYNAEKYLLRALESVVNQNFTDLEILCIDNNSPDGSRRLAEAYAAKYPGRIKILFEGKKGAPAARNKGLSHAQGEWIQFLDSDDELLPSKISSQICIADAKNPDIIIGNCIKYKNFESKSTKSMRFADSENVWRGLFTSRLGITSSNLWKKDAICKVGMWNESQSSSQEYELLFRLLTSNCKVAFCDEAHTIIHMNQNSISNSLDLNRRLEIVENNINLRVKIKDYLNGKNLLTSELRKEADKYILETLTSPIPITSIFYFSGKVQKYIFQKFRELSLKLSWTYYCKFFLKRLINDFRHS